ncbi:MAG TPA: hypothetical protein VGL71_04855, partial [Urbifossiella sp.]
MRRAVGAWALLLCVAANGCRTDSPGPFAFPRPEKATVAPVDSSVGGFGNAFGNAIDIERSPGLYVESILFERPLGDPLLDRDLWTSESAQISPKTRILLGENGLRVAILGGNLPRQFQKMLESKTEAVNPQGLTFAQRTEAVLPTVGPIDKCEYQVAKLSGEREPVKIRNANCGVLVRPERSADGRVKLYCEPQVQHGERQNWIRPTSDAIGFAMRGEIPVEQYPGLGFEVTIGPGEFLVIGWPAAAADTLGSAMFGVESK